MRHARFMLAVGGVCVLLATPATTLAAPRVIGGAVAPPGKYPFMVAVLVSNLTNGYQFLCGGTLVAPDRVLTAEHCVENVFGIFGTSGNESPSLYRVRYGFTAWSDPSRTVAVHAIIRNPAFDPSSITNDSAILVLDHPIRGITPVAVATPDQTAGVLNDTAALTVVGWGATAEIPGPFGTATDLYPNELREGTVNYHTPGWCQANLGALYDPTSEICVQSQATPAVANSCHGDSGGPLLASTATGPLEVGIVSWGFVCADPEQASVYTRISSYTQWYTTALSAHTGDISSDQPLALLNGTASNLITASESPQGTSLSCSLDRRILTRGDRVGYTWYAAAQPGFTPAPPFSNTTIAVPPGALNADSLLFAPLLAVPALTPPLGFGSFLRIPRTANFTATNGFTCLVTITRDHAASISDLVASNSSVASMLTWPARLVGHRCSRHGCLLVVRVPDPIAFDIASVRTPDPNDQNERAIDYHAAAASVVDVRTLPLRRHTRYLIAVGGVYANAATSQLSYTTTITLR
jgi:secreted trypsin-like serine protease